MKQVLAWTGSADSTITSEAVIAMALEIQHWMAFDTDRAAAAVSRKRMFDRVSADGILIAGMHLHFPAFAQLARRGDAYAFYPEQWIHPLGARSRR